MLSLLPDKLSYFHDAGLFWLDITHAERFTDIKMKMRSSILNTSYLPGTFEKLGQFLPTILKSKCYNPQNLPFASEVVKTEFGHLFEHILLENLYLRNLKKPRPRSFYRGYTAWNWQEEERGVFNIKIFAGMSDFEIFGEALEDSVKLALIILDENKGVFTKEYPLKF